MSTVFHEEYMRASNNGTNGPEKLSFEQRSVTAKGKGEMQTMLCTNLLAGQATAEHMAGIDESSRDGVRRRGTKHYTKQARHRLILHT